MNVDVEPTRRTSSVRLAIVISTIAALVAVVVSAAGDVPQAAIVLPVIVVAFVASWVQTSRDRASAVGVRATRSDRFAQPVR